MLLAPVYCIYNRSDKHCPLRSMANSRGISQLEPLHMPMYTCPQTHPLQRVACERTAVYSLSAVSPPFNWTVWPHHCSTPALQTAVEILMCKPRPSAVKFKTHGSHTFTHSLSLSLTWAHKPHTHTVAIRPERHLVQLCLFTASPWWTAENANTCSIWIISKTAQL